MTHTGHFYILTDASHEQCPWGSLAVTHLLLWSICNCKLFSVSLFITLLMSAFLHIESISFKWAKNDNYFSRCTCILPWFVHGYGSLASCLYVHLWLGDKATCQSIWHHKDTFTLDWCHFSISLTSIRITLPEQTKAFLNLVSKQEHLKWSSPSKEKVTPNNKPNCII